jgi:hypothetical protein
MHNHRELACDRHAGTFGAAAASRTLNAKLQLSPKPIPVGNVQRLTLFERGEHLRCLRRVVSIAAQFGYDLALPGEVLLAERNMLFGLAEMLFQHFPVHGGSLLPCAITVTVGTSSIPGACGYARIIALNRSSVSSV